jgi:type III secretory pathway component EscV
MALISIIGVLIAAAALIVSVISIKRQQSIIKRINKKEKLRELAHELGDLNNSIHGLIESYSQPEEHSDTRAMLESIGEKSLVYKHKHNKNTKFKYDSLYTYSNREKSTLETEEEYLAAVKNTDEMLFCNIKAVNADDIVIANDSNLFTRKCNRFQEIYKIIEEIESEYGDLIEEFDSEITTNIEKLIDDMNRKIFYQIIEDNTATINPDEYGEPIAMGIQTIEELSQYEGCDKNLSNLNEVMDDIEDLRQTILQTSYS